MLFLLVCLSLFVIFYLGVCVFTCLRVCMFAQVCVCVYVCARTRAREDPPSSRLMVTESSQFKKVAAMAKRTVMCDAVSYRVVTVSLFEKIAAMATRTKGVVGGWVVGWLGGRGVMVSHGVVLGVVVTVQEGRGDVQPHCNLRWY